MSLACHRLCVFLGAGLLAGWWAGCSSEPGEGRAAGSEAATNVVARVGDRVITIEALGRELALRSGGRSSIEARERVLREMVDREVLLLRAREAGFDRAPHVQAQMDRLLASLWEQEELARRTAESCTVTDAEIAAYYRANEAEFRKAPAIRAGVIRFEVGAHAAPERREEMRARAAGVRDLALRADEAGFRQLVQRHSDDQSTRYIGGDTGWIEEGQSVWRWDDAVVEAARGLNQPGDVAELVDTGTGFHVVRLVDRRGAALVPLVEVAEGIRYRLLRQKETKRQAEFLNELRQGLVIEINQPLLESLPVSADSQSPLPVPGG